jgi:CheY-like chemotaxis protein/DNA-binding XRE family transcriptional regulator
VLSLQTKPNGSNGDAKHGPARDAGAEAARGTEEHNDLYCSGEVRILVMDDDDAICRLVKETFAPQGFVIDAISDPAGMETQLKTRSYHVIVLDYVIPTLPSEQILDWVREYQPDASIIVVTAYPSIDSALNCLRARTHDYLTKPFQLGHLQRIVTRCLESKGLLRLSEQALRESLGNAIRERRKGLGLTLAQMAQRTGVSLGYLSQIELGKNSASIETLYRISLGLGVKMADLFLTIQNN